MLIEHLLDVGEESAEAGLLRTGPNSFYQAARAKFDSDPGFADRSRQRVVLLQGGDPGTLRLWQEMVDLSKEYLRLIYDRLRVTLTDDDIRGESFYNAMLPDIVAELAAKGIAVESEGALCVFPPGFTGRDGSPLPVIIRKSDGGLEAVPWLAGAARRDHPAAGHRPRARLHRDRHREPRLR
jgi:arginyl-tRNA synthetase